MSDNLHFYTNLNDSARVKLTEYGVSVYKKYYFDLDITPPELINNTVTTELWDLMNIFGSFLFNGSTQVFVDNEIKIEKRNY